MTSKIRILLYSTLDTIYYEVNYNVKIWIRVLCLPYRREERAGMGSVPFNNHYTYYFTNKFDFF